ncbi:MAG: glycoside hydrolase family 15 protein [Nocardioidaceae bacterium]
MATRTPILAALVLTAALLTPTSAAAGPRESERTGSPPGAPGAKATWTEADKAGFGTARSQRSNVWFTLHHGRTSEVFYPDLGTPSVRSLELVVTDGETFTDRESVDTRQRTRMTDDRSLGFTQVNTAKSGKYRIAKRYVTDPARDTLVVDVKVTSLDGSPYQVFALYDPSLANSGMDDAGRTSGRSLVARDAGGEPVASALTARPVLGATSTGYLGESDGWTDLKRDHRMDWHYGRAGKGNIVQTAQLSGVTGRAGARHTTLALGFGSDGAAAKTAADESLGEGYGAVAGRYAAGWDRYLDSLKPVPASAGTVKKEYLASTMVVAASEDKTHRGALIASPSAPWVWGDEIDWLASPSGAYHLVWSRDAYQFGTALWAAGDRAAARRVVDWLFQVQQKPDGSFPQNSQVDGTPVWSNLQLDEVALPIVLAWQVGRDDSETYSHVKKAADFITDFRDPETGTPAPYSPQERWENQAGYSPSTIAAQIAGLVCAADLARRNGDQTSAARWLETADEWQRKVEQWTVTTNGPYSEAPYYLRLTKDGNPDAGTTYSVGDGGPSSIDQRKVVDASFLDLVRLGVKPADSPEIVSTLPVIDEQLQATTPNGPFWRRYNHDGYGETRTGGQWRITDPDTFETLGRAWPLLAGERGEYTVASGGDATTYLKSMAAAGNSGRMIAEQVWDGRPPSGQPGFPPGEGTRSATPLIWSHAQLVRLAWSIERGRPVETPSVVADRYVR